jgi:molybdopterin synthase sulfur carrier subunit
MTFAMRVDFYGIYRPIVGEKTIEFGAGDGLSVRQLLDAIVTRFPAMRAELLDARGQLYPFVPIYVNGRNPRLLPNGLDTALLPEDNVSLFSPLASGRLNVEDIKRQGT